MRRDNRDRPCGVREVPFADFGPDIATSTRAGPAFAFGASQVSLSKSGRRSRPSRRTMRCPRNRCGASNPGMSCGPPGAAAGLISACSARLTPIRCLSGRAGPKKRARTKGCVGIRSRSAGFRRAVLGSIAVAIEHKKVNICAWAGHFAGPCDGKAESRSSYLQHVEPPVFFRGRPARVGSCPHDSGFAGGRRILRSIAPSESVSIRYSGACFRP